jgi:hypothetical protein
MHSQTYPRAEPRLIRILCGCLGLSLAGLLSCSPRAPQFAVRDADRPMPERWRKEPIIILSDTTIWTVRIAGDSNVLEEKSITWYRINKRNPADLETLRYTDDESTQKRVRIRIDAFYPNGRHVSWRDRDFRRERMQEDGLYASNAFQSAFKLPGYQSGLILRSETSDTVTRPQFQSHVGLRMGYPCAHRSLAWRTPEHFNLRAGLSNGEGLAVRESVSVAGGYREMLWQADSLDKPDAGNAFKYPEDRLTALWVSIPQRGRDSWTWKQAGDYYLDLIRPSLESRSGLPARVPAQASIANGDSAEASVEAAFALIQGRIRYLADETRMNAFIPRAPAYIWAKGYGDCKEMANLLRALAREGKVGMGLALIQSGYGAQLRSEYPSLGTFNHMIAYRRGEDGRLRFYDPTVPFGTAEASSLHLLYQKALLLAPGASAPDTLMSRDVCPNRIVTRSQFSRSGNGGPFTLTGSITLKGAIANELAFDLRYRDTHPEEARSAIGAFLRNSFSIEANSFDWALSGSDSLAITYVLGRTLDPDGDGLLLDAPSLYTAWGPARTGFNSPISQRDEWILPAGLQGSRTWNFGNQQGDLAWQKGPGRISRIFTGKLARFRREDEPACLSDRDSLFSHAAAWVGQ